ncbi:unnamed protein product [Darwinula stevensoni]|uniref:Uncharacterized protein n=1 Tax=Darwinula stevensoni TaxID=69355 RepID=A0A7R8ZZI9_9CRUS|nr:unnamed protein product [Darwinula stevensoni]CAG0883788.1 unnamed protein product [Darwinula stevensoni]
MDLCLRARKVSFHDREVEKSPRVRRSPSGESLPVCAKFLRVASASSERARTRRTADLGIVHINGSTPYASACVRKGGEAGRVPGGGKARDGRRQKEWREVDESVLAGIPLCLKAYHCLVGRHIQRLQRSFLREEEPLDSSNPYSSCPVILIDDTLAGMDESSLVHAVQEKLAIRPKKRRPSIHVLDPETAGSVSEDEPEADMSRLGMDLLGVPSFDLTLKVKNPGNSDCQPADMITG